MNSFMRAKILHKSQIYIAEQMNNHFCPLGSKEASGFPDTVLQPEDFLSRTDSYCYFLPLNVGYIHNPISSLKPSVSCGLDIISSRLLKLVVRISHTLYRLYMWYYKPRAGDWNFPDDWKKAKVRPIFKSDKRNILSNYRSISILPAISKIIESVLHTQVLEYFQAGNLLTES